MRIHAYNILRILFRDSSLGEVVSPFISDGLRAAIGGFKASQWPVSILLEKYINLKDACYMSKFW